MMPTVVARIVVGFVAVWRASGREQGGSDRRGQDKSRKVRPVGRGGEHRKIPTSLRTLRAEGATCALCRRAVAIRFSAPCAKRGHA
jgi:hypothetical protein